MRIQVKNQSMELTNSLNTIDMNLSKQLIEDEQPVQKEEQVISEEKLHQAVNSINEIVEMNQSELKFEFHEGLEEYFVQLVDSETKKVVREIPAKKILDTFYEMQKLAGMIIDEKI